MLGVKEDLKKQNGKKKKKILMTGKGECASFCFQDIQSRWSNQNPNYP